MQYTNASIFMGKLFYDLIFVPTEGVACSFRWKQYRREEGVCQCACVCVCVCVHVCVNPVNPKV